MRRVGGEHGIEMLDHDPNIGGRYAALTAVGLLPAKVAGLDIQAVRAGAAEVVERTFLTDAAEPALGAALHHALLKKGKTVSVIMPYCDRLSAFSAWHQQLWSESLGKKGHGTTALRALGAFDQHSQLQLYLDGPCDKFFTLVLLRQENTGAAIPASKEKPLGYLSGHTIGDLMAAEQRATVETLVGNKRPVRVLSLDALNEESMGALMMHFMLETMVTGRLWGIDAFDQPAVEQGKRLARECLASDTLQKASNA
jgi:glucose-6-phosphate isomerase